MKTKSTLRSFLSIASSALLTISYSQATSLNWDDNSTTAGAGATPTGTWGTDSNWNTDSTGGAGGALQVGTLNTDDLFFVAAPGAASGNNAYVVTVDTARVANSLTFQASGATTLSGGTSITLGDGTAGVGGITMNQFAFGSTAQGAVTISTAIALANSQTWTNNSANALTLGAGGLSLGADTLTFSGTGNFTASSGTFGNAGTGGIIMNGTGVLNVRAATNTNYTGSTTVNSGVILLNGGSKSTGNFNLNGGMITDYFQQTGAFTSGLGTGSNQIQITGNSGFGAGNGTSTWRIGTAGSVLIWGASGEGAATGFFNPTTLKFQTAADNNGPTIYGIANFDNGLNLNGVARTIDVLTASAPIPTNSGAQIAGVISNGSLIKTGGGNLTLSNASNSYAGTTTISGGFLTVASSGALGSASNSLEFNGGTLRATGTITSPSTRAVTMTATGIIDTNGQAISIAGNITGAGGLTKNSTGTLTLSGTNSFGGVTTVNAGSLQFAKTVSLYNDTAASWTAANINVKNGAALALNVDSAGSNGFDSADLNTLLTNISVANTSAQGLQKGAILTLDTSTATGATFTQGNALANSTGANGGAISLTKIGAGTLIFDKANTYTGATTISAGTLQLDAGGVIATPISNNATFTVNSAGAVTQGTNFGLISGTGAVTNAGAGTLTLNLANTHSGLTTATAGTIALTNARALQNSALVTTSGTTTLGAFSAVTIGGLSGTTGDLGSVSVLNGFTGNVSALTLNPQTGVTVTYGGIISNGTGAMTLTKTGAGTQILTGANTYTGATIINAGTLSIGVGGSLSSSSALQMGGGTFSYGNTAAGLTLNGFTVGAGNSTLSNTASGQTLTLGAITRTASAFGTVNFATLTGPISTTTGNTNGIIGPWATTGSTTTLRYAVGSPDGSTPTSISALTGTTATAADLSNVTSSTTNYEYSAATTTVGNLTANTLRYHTGGATATVIGATNTLTLNGLMNAGAGLLTISGGPTTGGIIIGSTGELVIAANAQGTTISAAIGGTGRLVYSGAGTLLLSSTTSNYSGGTVINAGQLRIASDAALGNSSGSITLNGGTFLGNNTNPQAGNGGGVNITSARDVIVGVAGGSMGAQGNNNFTTTGKLSGSGTLTFIELGGAGGRALNFNATTNDFTGRMIIQSNSNTLSVNSLLDTAGSGNIALNLGAANNGSTFAYGAGATSALTLNNRAFELNASGAFTGTIQNNNTTQAISIGSNLIATGAGAKTLVLGAVAGPNNAFSGKITDGPGSVISLSVNGAGHWIVSGNNTYTGQTTVSGNTGATLTLSGDNSGMTGNVVLSTGTGTATSAPRLNINSATALGTGILNFGGGLASDVVRIDNTSAGAVSVSTANAITMNRNFTFVGTQDLSLGTGTTTLGGMTTGSNRTITVTAKSLTLGGTIAEATANLGITKAGAGTLILSGTGNSYTGATTVSAGTLAGIGANAFGSTSGISIAGAGTLSLRGDSNTSFVKTSDSSLYTVSNSASGSTINVDRVTGTGINTLTIGNLPTTSTAVTWQLNFTGSNGVSLNADTLTTPTAAAGSHTINNNITGGGSLTLASVAGGGTGAAATLIFTGAANTTVSGAITQVATAQALTKNGAGTLLLNGTSTYTGLTTVSAGTLGGTGVIAGDVTVAAAGSLAPGNSAGTLSIGGGLDISAPVDGGTGKLVFELGPIAASDKLAVTGTLTIGTDKLGFADFTFEGLTGLQNGTYKLITSGAAVGGTLDAANLSGAVGSGTGTLQISTSGTDIELVVSGIGGGTPYENWATGGELFGDDANKDGVENGLAFLLGAANPNANALGLLPKVDESGGGLVLTFSMLNAASRGTATLSLEHSGDLGDSDPWTSVLVPDATPGGPVSGVTFTVTPGSPKNTVTATISSSEALSGKLFGRLKGSP